MCAVIMFFLLPITASANDITDTLTISAFDSAVVKFGFTKVFDYSNSSSISIAEPECAYINITGIKNMPGRKGRKFNVWIEAYMGNGAYFKKRAIIDGHGNSSLTYEKRNFKADFCEDDWIGDNTPDIKIGGWVKQDSYHFKAYYIDYLRGVANIGYRLYDMMAQNVGRPWTRASEYIADPKKTARCYPDGFPCIVYLNGDFYGIYAWQLKKHRKNMNQDKSNAQHIHLDGTLSDATFWHTDSIEWGQFEIRNPKNLIAMDGKLYDGDSPSELIDNKAIYHAENDSDDIVDNDIYDAMQFTTQVKNSIIDLSHQYSEIQQMIDNHTDISIIKSYFEEHFDVQSLIDYACLHYVINNYDGFAKNWQWFTYNGIKWFVTPYDLDCTFGNHASGNFIIPVNNNSLGEKYTSLRSNGPFKFINAFYTSDLKNRYCQLRENGIIDSYNIINYLYEWYNRIGEDNYSLEWKKWSNSKCISEIEVSQGWKLIGQDMRWLYSEYDPNLTYYPTDQCRVGEFIWEATDTISGVRPYVKLGYQDSLERYENWIVERIGLLDSYFQCVSSLPTDNKELHFENDEFAELKNDIDHYQIYDILGRKYSSYISGINLCVGRNGKVIKLINYY